MNKDEFQHLQLLSDQQVLTRTDALFLLLSVCDFGQLFLFLCVTQVRWLRSMFPSLDIEVDGGVGPDTIHKCAEVRNSDTSRANRLFRFL